MLFRRIKIVSIALFAISGSLYANPWNPNFDAGNRVENMLGRINDLWGLPQNSQALIDAITKYMPGVDADEAKRMLLEDYLLETRNAALTRALKDAISTGLSTLSRNVEKLPREFIQLLAANQEKLAQAKLSEIAAQGEVDKELLAAKISALKDVTKMIGEGIFNTLGDKQRMTYIGAGIVGIIAGYFVVKHATRITADQIEKMLNTPKLLTETSWVNPLTRAKNAAIAAAYSAVFGKPKTRSIHEQIVLAPEIAKQITTLTAATEKIHATGGTYQNLLLYGDPGTGKTLFATLLAKQTGMDYAILAGPNFDQFDDEEALIQLNKLFDWAETRNKGVIIFIDEAETFLGKRSELSQRNKRLLNAFLARTGSGSKKYMLVCATNRPDMLDAAALSRLAIKLEFKKPALEQRIRLLELYLGNEFPKTYFEDTLVHALAEKIDGFSGREIAQLVTGIKAEMLGNNQGDLTPNIINVVVDQFVGYHQSAQQLKAFA